VIPPYNELGYLPLGIWLATLDEIEARFAKGSEVRRVQMESLRWLVDLARTAGVARLIINGSFVTDVLEPADVDCVLLIEAGFPQDRDAEEQLLSGLPFIELELVDRDGFDLLVSTIFATDRQQKPKGMIEVKL